MKYTKFIPLLILIFAFLIRLYNFDYPLESEESNRDFLVSSHIAKYHEFVLLGTTNGTFLSLGNSPIYNYLLALPILLKNDIIFVGLFNLLLQVAAVGILYLLAERMFGQKTAILAGALAALSPTLIAQSNWVWQPHLMFPFVNLSYLLLLLSYQKKELRLLLAGAFFFVLAGAIHMSAFALLPLFLVLSFLVLKNQKRKAKDYLAFIAVVSFSLLILYLPLIYATLKSGAEFPQLGQGLIKSFYQFPAKFAEIIFQFSGSFSKSYPNLFPLLTPILTLVYFLKIKDRRPRIYMALSAVAILTILSVTSLIGGSASIRHLVPVLGIALILLAEIIMKVFSGEIYLKAVKIIIIAALFVVLTNNYSNPKWLDRFAKRRAIEEITNSLSSEILKIGRQEKLPGLNFFRFQFYHRPAVIWSNGKIWFIDYFSKYFGGGKYDVIFWIPLEKKLDYRFVRVGDFGRQNGFEVLNDDRFLFVGCLSFQDRTEEEQFCKEPFVKENPNFKLGEQVADVPGYTFYLARRVN